MAERYEALVRVSEALGACHDRDVLFRSLARELHHIANFSFLGLALYDERTHTMEPCVLENYRRACTTAADTYRRVTRVLGFTAPATGGNS
jgi:hypothetical protein